MLFLDSAAYCFDAPTPHFFIKEIKVELLFSFDCADISALLLTLSQIYEQSIIL